MLRSFQAPQGALVLFQSPSRRQRLARRRLYVISAIVGLALASGAIGVLTRPHATATATSTYLPSE